MTRRTLWALIVSAIAAPSAWAAPGVPGFPVKAPGLIGSGAVAGDMDGGGTATLFFVSAGELHCRRGDARACEGFPVALPEKTKIVGLPAVGDLDGDKKAEVVLALTSGELLAFHGDGSPVTTLSFKDEKGFESGPALFDLDGDHKAEVLIGAKDGRLHALTASGELAGFPVKLGGSLTSTPSAALFGTPARLAVAVGSEDGKVYVVDGKGQPLAGFPVATQYIVSGQPAFGDIDGDGDNDLAFASQDFSVYAVHGNGKSFAGFPQKVGARLLTGPALGDLDGDGKLEILQASVDGRVQALKFDGKPVQGFPAKVGEKLAGNVIAVDLDRDGKDEVLAATADGNLHALKANGKAVPGFPAKLGGEPEGGPVAWTDNAGTSEYVSVYAVSGDKLAGFRGKRSGKSQAPLSWPASGHDGTHQGRRSPNPSGYAELKIEPSNAQSHDALKAAWRFYDLDGDPEPEPLIKWLRDGKEVPELANKREVPQDFTKKHEKWRFEVAAPGGASFASPELNIGNSKPKTATLAFEPETLRRGEPAKVKIVKDAPDPDQDKLTYRYAWQKNGKPQPKLTAAELPPGTMKRGEIWSVQVSADDGESVGPAASLEGVVGDTAPTAPEVALEPAQPKTGDAVRAVVKKGSEDADGDKMKYQYRFFIDGQEVHLAAGLDTLPPFSAKKKQTVSVEVRGDDGELVGPPGKAQVAVANTPPASPVATLAPTTPVKGDTLVAGLTAPSKDDDGDALSYRFSFSRDGKKSAEGRELKDLKKGEVVEVEVVANDGESDSAPGKAKVTVGNRPPGAPQIGFAVEVAKAGEPLSVKLEKPAVDEDGDALTYGYAWLVNGKPSSVKGETVPAGVTKKGEIWSAEVTADDKKSAGKTARAEVRIGGNPPSAPEVVLEPSNPKSVDAIRAVVKKEAKDADGDKVTYRFRFFIDGVAVAQPETADVLPARSARRKQVVSVEVTADDGEAKGPAAKAQVTVANTPPEAPKVVLSPESPLGGDTVVASVLQPATDADGDKLSYRYTLIADGKKLTGGERSVVVKGSQTVELEVVANDGEADSAVARAKVAVGNRAPGAPQIAFTNEAPKAGEPLAVKLEKPAVDEDGDALTYRYTWLVNGKPATVKGESVPAGTTKKGDVWTVEVAADDHKTTGTPARALVTVRNNPPGAPEVVLEPSQPKTGDTLRAVVKKDGKDLDGDKLKYSYRFLVNGLAVAQPESQDTLPAKTAHRKQVVSVEVRADDGEAQSPVATAQVTVANTPPEAPKVALSPEKPHGGDTVVAALVDPATDADGDKLTYRFTLTRDGKKLTGAEREIAVKGGETLELEAVANDGEADSPPARAKVSALNTPPTAPAVAFADLAPHAGEAVDVKIVTPGGDADGDAVSYEYAFLVDGKPAGLPKGSKAIPAGRLKKHEVWTVEVTPHDGHEAGPVARSQLTVQNSAPTAPKVTLTPAEPTASSTVKAKLDAPASDKDSDALTYRYAWYRDGARIEAPETAAELAAGTVHAGEAVRVVVTASDGEATSPMASATTAVKNSAPSAPEVELLPAKPTVKDALTCRIKSPAKDPDGTTPTLRYSWLRNGERLPLAPTTEQIAAGTARHGETWRCEVVADDGELSSAAAGAEVKVQNTPPGAPQSVIEPENARAGEELRCRVSKPAEDADGDVLSYAFSWTAGGKPLAADPKDPSRVPAAIVKKGQNVRCEVTASDGHEKGPVASAEKSLRNAAPSRARVRIKPDAPAPGSTLACDISEPAVDPDGDAVRYRFQWTLNGVVQNFADSSNEVPGRLVKTNGTWKCAVIPSDSEVDGPAGESVEVTVSASEKGSER